MKAVTAKPIESPSNDHADSPKLAGHVNTPLLMSDSIFRKYGDIIVEVSRTADGYKFSCPMTGCNRTTDVRGHIITCENRIYQHLHLEHRLTKQDVDEWPPGM